ncbi:MAG: energy transducer TonB [Ekhidna sp.]
MSEDKNHSEQFERYLKGQMSPKEANAFEREVLDDPFVQEALEGFESSGTGALNDIEKLKGKISIQKKKSFPIMKVAATVALLMVAFFSVYLFTGQLNGEQLAMDEEPMGKIIQNTPAPDTLLLMDKMDEQIAEEKEARDIQTQEIDPAPVASIKSESEKELMLTEEADVAIDVAIAEEAAIVTQESEIVDVVDNFMIENDSFDDDLPSRVANVQVAQTEKPALHFFPDTVNLEEVVITAQPLVAQKEALGNAPEDAGVGKRAKKSVAGASYRSTSADEIISEMAETTELEEVIETPYDSNTAEGSGYKSAQPAEGKRAFKTYLEENLKYSEAAKTNEIEGTVVLELVISSSGEISDIIIKRSLGYGCDEEAIRLVREGPDWNAAEKDGLAVEDKVNVRVKFKLDL